MKNLRKRTYCTVLVPKKTYKDIPFSGATENTKQFNNAQSIEKKRNTQNKTTNTVSLNPSNITKWELVREDETNTNTNTSIQQQ